ncbi:hypothetical protein QE152_g29476 [Popillia japonica]|uniref:Transposase n=1 Tax=Popillia japonica TaxID=7064 RepID=A0AAW1JI06_POPJA
MVLNLKKPYSEKASANLESAEDWKLTKLPELLQTYSADNIYNADETALFYGATPDSKKVIMPTKPPYFMVQHQIQRKHLTE